MNHDELVAALEQADVRILLMVLVHLTGDRSWLEAPYLPRRDVQVIADKDAGLPPEVRARIRAGALSALEAGREPAIGRPSDDLMLEMMGRCLGEEVDPAYVPMMLQEMGLAPERIPDLAPPAGRAMTATVIGAGVSGICAAIRLTQAGVAVEVLDKNPSVGGTWFENTYPDCGVDVPNQFYSYSFAPHDGWSRYFSLRDEIYDYLRRCVDDFGVRAAMHLGATVRAAEWDAGNAEWLVTYTDATGATGTRRSDILVSAVGQLNRPSTPRVPGLDGFTGRCFHSSRWPSDLDVTDLDGLRVGVVGAGASAMQLVPKVAERAASLVVFQRTPQWVHPIADYRAEVPGAVHLLLREVPYYRAWLRFTLAWRQSDGLHRHLWRDPEWEHPERSLNRTNDRHREELTKHVERSLAERPDLIPAVLPSFPPYGKRILIDNGWFRTLTRANVTLVPGGLREVAGGEVTADDGSRHALDVLVMATGFAATDLLGHVDVRGRDGVRLADQWGTDDPRAYLGITVPNFPNLFVLYGPNTNVAHGGSIIFHAECQVRYLLSLLEQMRAGGIESVEVRTDVHDEYNKRVDDMHHNLVWSHPAVSSWYRNAAGRVVANSPWRFVDYWHMTEHADLDEYTLAPAGRR